MEDFKKNQRWNLIIILLIIVGFGIFYATRGGTAPSFDMDEERFILRGPEEFETELRLEDIAEVTLLENFTPETCISGGATRTCAYGTWENEDLGQYRICALLKVKTCVAVREMSGALTIFNFENAQTTEEFYKSFYEYLTSHGFL